MTDPWLSFHPVLFFPLSMGLLLLLAFFMLWLEWKRAVSFRSLRLLAVVIVVISLAGLIFRPRYKTVRSDTTILLTTGYSANKIDSLQKLYPGVTILHAPGVKKYKSSVPLISWHELSTDYPDIDFIIGQGLPAAALDLITPQSFQFLPSGTPAGILQINASTPVFPNRRAVVDGVIRTIDPGTTLYLEGPGGKEDSIRYENPGIENFQLTFTPKEPGNFLYTLRSDKRPGETFPVQVREHPVSDILFIQNYPTFESRYLKNFLGKQHRLLFRYRLSKNTFRYEYINRGQQSLAKLTEGSLSMFDLLLIDTDALQSFSNEEIHALRQAIRSGLGMIIMFNEEPSGVKRIRDFLRVRFNKISSDTAKFGTALSGSLTLPAWAVAPVSDRPLISTLKNKSRILSGYSPDGLGKIGFQLLQETYRLSLQGDSVTYNTLWSDLLEQTARSGENKFALQLSTPWPLFADEPVVAEIISSGPEPELWADKSRISLMEDPLVDDVWRGEFRVDQPGWHAITIANDSTRLEYYISEKDTWPSLTSANATRETSLRAAPSKPENMFKDLYEPVPFWIFYVLFVASTGFLWLAPKLQG